MPDRPPPSTAAIALATAILGVLAGYFFAQASSLGLFSSSPSSSARASKSGSAPKKSWPNSYDVTLHPDSSDEELMKGLRGEPEARDESSEEEPAEDGTGLRAFEGVRDDCKLVLVVRTDLGMQKGKIAAQCSHATLSNYRLLLSQPHLSPLLRRWESTGQAKIALQAPNALAGGDEGARSMNDGGEGELEKLRAQARQLGLCATIVHDAGRTQIAAGSATVLGVGPGPKSVVDRVTGGLKLL